MDSTFIHRANEVFIPVVFLEAGASETLVYSRAKRAQSELEALIAPRRVEGSQRNFLDSLPTPYSVNHSLSGNYKAHSMCTRQTTADSLTGRLTLSIILTGSVGSYRRYIHSTLY